VKFKSSTPRLRSWVAGGPIMATELGMVGGAGGPIMTTEVGCPIHDGHLRHERAATNSPGHPQLHHTTSTSAESAPLYQHGAKPHEPCHHRPQGLKARPIPALNPKGTVRQTRHRTSAGKPETPLENPAWHDAPSARRYTQSRNSNQEAQPKTPHNPAARRTQKALCPSPIATKKTSTLLPIQKRSKSGSNEPPDAHDRRPHPPDSTQNHRCGRP
jgi:hypothetical protein